MDPTAAARIIESLDLELARRQAKRDAVQDAAWAEEFEGDEVILTAKRLDRAWDRKQRLPFFELLGDAEGDVVSAADFAKQLFAIATVVDREEDRREDEAAGVEHEFVRVTMVRPQYKTGPPM
jgi:hypothetical protein